MLYYPLACRHVYILLMQPFSTMQQCLYAMPQKSPKQAQPFRETVTVSTQVSVQGYADTDV